MSSSTSKSQRSKSTGQPAKPVHFWIWAFAAFMFCAYGFLIYVVHFNPNHYHIGQQWEAAVAANAGASQKNSLANALPSDPENVNSNLRSPPTRDSSGAQSQTTLHKMGSFSDIAAHLEMENKAMQEKVGEKKVSLERARREQDESNLETRDEAAKARFVNTNANVNSNSGKTNTNIDRAAPVPKSPAAVVVNINPPPKKHFWSPQLPDAKEAKTDSPKKEKDTNQNIANVNVDVFPQSSSSWPKPYQAGVEHEHSSTTNTNTNNIAKAKDQGHHFVLPPASPAKAKTAHPAVTVVCGTDGSGTRRVVQTLTQLGVLMVSEDPETYDIHGDLMGGWPTVVKPVVATMRTLNYIPPSGPVGGKGRGKDNSISHTGRTGMQVPAHVHNRVSSALRRLLARAREDSSKGQSFRLAVGGALPRSKGTTAAGVSFGFKAPVAMTLAPYWASLEPHFRLLHVVRDGRDIALSANQGPVEKFYGDMYGGKAAPVAPVAAAGVDYNDKKVKAIRLWSDWNEQVYTWAGEHAATLSHVDDGSASFGYMLLHTEDLASAFANVRFKAISALAHWVDSSIIQKPATERDTHLCCIAQGPAKFMGSHDRVDRNTVRKQTGGKEQQEISRRYGKWKVFAQQQPAQGAALKSAGKRGLELFGYETSSSGSDSSSSFSSGTGTGTGTGTSNGNGNGFMDYYESSTTGGDFVCPEATEDSLKACEKIVG